MDTDKENGNVENVDALYKNDYTLKSAYMDFDFKNGTASTKAPVNITGSRLSMRGIGLTANTRRETVTLESDVSGTMETGKTKYKFPAATLTYHFKDDLYILQGKVVSKEEDIALLCGRLHIYASNQNLERVEAYEKVNIISKGTVAKSEKAVYHFKEGKIIFTNSPKVFKDNVEMKGKSITYTTNDGKISADNPKIRLNNK
jgi:lipopolysaccharide transport protein LptA